MVSGCFTTADRTFLSSQSLPKKKKPSNQTKRVFRPKPTDSSQQVLGLVWFALVIEPLLLMLLLPSGGTAHHTMPHLPIIWKDTIRWGTSREIFSYWVLEFTHRWTKNRKHSVGFTNMNSFTVCTNLSRNPCKYSRRLSQSRCSLFSLTHLLYLLLKLFLTLVISQIEKHKIKVHQEEQGMKTEQKPIKGPPTLVSAALALEGKLKVLLSCIAWSLELDTDMLLAIKTSAAL